MTYPSHRSETGSRKSSASSAASDESWRKPGKLFRHRLLASDKNAFALNTSCAIERYYQVADRVLEQFLQHPIDTRDELIEAYLIGSRLSHFLSSILPTHPLYFDTSSHLTLLRDQSQRQMVDLVQYIDQIAKMIDREEHQQYIERVLSKTAAPATEQVDTQQERAASAMEILVSTNTMLAEQGSDERDLSSQAVMDVSNSMSTASDKRPLLSSARKAARQPRPMDARAAHDDWESAWVQNMNESLSVGSSQFETKHHEPGFYAVQPRAPPPPPSDDARRTLPPATNDSHWTASPIRNKPMHASAPVSAVRRMRILTDTHDTSRPERTKSSRPAESGRDVLPPQSSPALVRRNEPSFGDEYRPDDWRYHDAVEEEEQFNEQVEEIIQMESSRRTPEASLGSDNEDDDDEDDEVGLNPNSLNLDDDHFAPIKRREESSFDGADQSKASDSSPQESATGSPTDSTRSRHTNASAETPTSRKSQDPSGDIFEADFGDVQLRPNSVFDPFHSHFDDESNFSFGLSKRREQLLEDMRAEQLKAQVAPAAPKTPEQAVKIAVRKLDPPPRDLMQRHRKLAMMQTPSPRQGESRDPPTRVDLDETVDLDDIDDIEFDGPYHVAQGSPSSPQAKEAMTLIEKRMEAARKAKKSPTGVSQFEDWRSNDKGPLISRPRNLGFEDEDLEMVNAYSVVRRNRLAPFRDCVRCLID